MPKSDICLFVLLFATSIYHSHPYRTFFDDDPHLCSPITKRKIKLGKDYESGALIKLNGIKHHTIRWDFNFRCEFEVVASKETNGVFAVIQQMVLRKNETIDECIDYVQLQRKDGRGGKRFCGRLNGALSMDQLFAPDMLVNSLEPASNSYVDPNGHLQVLIHVAKEPLREDEERELIIAFTSYKYCFLANRETYERCSDDMKECIYKDYIRDGVINCPYLNCVDEKGCTHNEMVVEKRLTVGDKVIIGSITSIVSLFLVFVACIYLCRKFRICFWSENFANPSQTQNNRTIELAVTGTQRAPPPQPTAPSVDEDKDLPPAYDTLFPR